MDWNKLPHKVTAAESLEEKTAGVCMQAPPLFNSSHTYVIRHFFVNSHLEAELYPGSEFVVAPGVVANTLAKWKKLEPNEIDFSQGFSQSSTKKFCI